MPQCDCIGWEQIQRLNKFCFTTLFKFINAAFSEPNPPEMSCDKSTQQLAIILQHPTRGYVDEYIIRCTSSNCRQTAEVSLTAPSDNVRYNFTGLTPHQTYSFEAKSNRLGKSSRWVTENCKTQQGRESCYLFTVCLRHEDLILGLALCNRGMAMKEHGYIRQ